VKCIVTALGLDVAFATCGVNVVVIGRRTAFNHAEIRSIKKLGINQLKLDGLIRAIDVD
jgi:hypothetical protein